MRLLKRIWIWVWRHTFVRLQAGEFARRILTCLSRFTACSS